MLDQYELTPPALGSPHAYRRDVLIGIPFLLLIPPRLRALVPAVGRVAELADHWRRRVGSAEASSQLD